MRSGSARSARWAVVGVMLTMFSWPGAAQDQQGTGPSDVEVWRMIIRDSIQSYRELCPCPYSENRAGRSCGTRSAYSRVDGSVVCYPSDISNAEVVRYRQRLQNQSGSVQGQQGQ